MAASTAGWLSPAAYLYALYLDGPALAWEYLRRNPDYLCDWENGHEHSSDRTLAAPWGLRLLEDPHRDARDAQPAWRPEIHSAVLVQPDADPPQNALPFGFWSIPGRKSLVHDGKRLILTSQQTRRTVRVSLALDVEEGQPYAYAIRSDGDLRGRLRDLEFQLTALDTETSRHALTKADRPDRIAVMHMRILQALDGAAAGASQRDIAQAIFGAAQLAGRWHSDDALRAQVRHLLRRGRALMQGGYRRLLGYDAARQGDLHPAPESP